MSETKKEDKEVYYFDKEPELSVIQKIVNGYFEIINLPDNLSMYVNEQGILMGLPINKKASEIAGFKIYGKVLIVKNYFL